MIKIDKVEATALWLDGKLDTEIAEHFNCAKLAVSIWRNKNDLPINKRLARSKKSLVNHEHLTKLWENGLKDSEIAKELKCSTITVWQFRKENGMGSNVGLFSWDGHKESRGKVEGK